MYRSLSKLTVSLSLASLLTACANIAPERHDYQSEAGTITQDAHQQVENLELTGQQQTAYSRI